MCNSIKEIHSQLRFHLRAARTKRTMASERRPQINITDAYEFIKKAYNIKPTEITELIAYDDRNFRVKSNEGEFVLKVTNAEDSKNQSFMEAQTRVMLILEKENFKCPVPRLTVDGKYFTLEQLNGGTCHFIRLLKYVPGTVLNETPPERTMYYDVGRYLGLLLQKFSKIDAGYYKEHTYEWMLEKAADARMSIKVIPDCSRRQMVLHILNEFEENIIKNKEKFQHGLIHGDYNENNIIVSKNQNENFKVYGVIDLNDICYSPIIFDLAIGMAYMMIHSGELETGGFVLHGFESTHKISDREKESLILCIKARICQSVTLGLQAHSLEPNNAYILSSQVPGWKLLETFSTMKDEEIWKIWNSL